MKRTGTSNTTVVALFIVGLIIGAGAIYALGITSATTQTVTQTSTQTVATTVTAAANATVTVTQTAGSAAACVTCLGGINNTMLLGAAQAAGNVTGTFTIGDLQDLTDGLAGQGLDGQATTAFAISDINAWVQTTPLAGKVTFQQNLQDYKEDNVLTSTIMNTYLSQGIHVVVGPLNSGAAIAQLPFANSHQIVMISPSSTSPLASIPGDYLFRTPPSDAVQGQVDAAELKQSGVQDVVIVYRNDDYGLGLANSTATNFMGLGGHVEAQIPYDTTISNYVSILGSVNDAYNSAVSKYGATHVALYFISFDEFGQIATQTAANYPSLLQTPLPWFGTDGEGDEAPIVNSTYASASVATRLAASFPGFVASPLAQSVCARQLAVRGTLCSGYTLGDYDDMWLAALAILYCVPASHYTATQNGQCIQQTLPAIAAGFNGATGVTLLNTAGDRLYASYQFFCIVPGAASGSAKWINCGYWTATNPTTVVWSTKPQGLP
jgi:ABC-type branched-subunit amino acid transport system substrate-binding protein